MRKTVKEVIDILDNSRKQALQKYFENKDGSIQETQASALLNQEYLWLLSDHGLLKRGAKIISALSKRRPFSDSKTPLATSQAVRDLIMLINSFLVKLSKGGGGATTPLELKSLHKPDLFSLE